MEELIKLIEELKDPSFIGPVEWAKLGAAQVNLWFMVLFVVLFASNLILGHNVIPSYVASGHLSAAWQKLRPVLYAAAVICFILAMFFLSRAVDNTITALRGVYPNFWI